MSLVEGLKPSQITIESLEDNQDSVKTEEYIEHREFDSEEKFIDERQRVLEKISWIKKFLTENWYNSLKKYKNSPLDAYETAKDSFNRLGNEIAKNRRDSENKRRSQNNSDVSEY